jgi:hypothetical protein
MRKHMQEDIFEKYSKLIDYDKMRWGLECGDGWFDIIDKLFAVIEYHDPATRVVRVKEKYGLLRVDVVTQSEFIKGAVAMAEAVSARTCEECGKPGVTSAEGWIRTLCPSHDADRSDRIDRVQEELGFGN